MTALPRIRSFSAPNWQILINNNPECGPLMASPWRSFFGTSRQQVLYSENRFVQTRIKHGAAKVVPVNSEVKSTNIQGNSQMAAAQRLVHACDDVILMVLVCYREFDCAN